MDVDSIIKNLLGGIGTRAQAPIPASVFGFAPQTPYAYDPKKAQQLLADAGVKPGPEVDLIWQPTGGPQVTGDRRRNRLLLERRRTQGQKRSAGIRRLAG